MNTIATLIATTIAAFLLIIGFGQAECFSECYGNGTGMQCGTCDSPKDGESRMSTLWE
ncbi:hypothetical protein SKC41_13605 [Mycobacterium sp. 050128]|uniref:hypothetical protein n=1 Tax=Mycobacterium sp. 050128 TaxID=3096112 RepID=UPI002ED94A07